MANGVFPVHNNIFKVGINGRTSTAEQMATVKDLTTFSISIDGNVEEWSPMDTAGWMRRAVTGKGMTIGFSGKRCYGDPGNDYIAGLLLGTGQDVETVFEWTLPSGSVLRMNCIINLTAAAGGDSTEIDNLEFELMSDGLPTFTAGGVCAPLTFVCTDGTTVGTTKIASVSPALTGGNNYMYKVNADVPALDTDLTTGGWTDYTINTEIYVADDNIITLVEVTAANLAKKAGQATTVVE